MDGASPPSISDRERAALELAEAVTEIGRTRVPDDVYAAARAQFSEEELVKMVLAIAVINAWNRLSITFRSVPAIDARGSADGGRSRNVEIGVEPSPDR